MGRHRKIPKKLRRTKPLTPNVVDRSLHAPPLKKDDLEQKPSKRDVAFKELLHNTKQHQAVKRRARRSQKAVSVPGFDRLPYESNDGYVQRISRDTTLQVRQELAQIKVATKAEDIDERDAENKLKHEKRLLRKDQKRRELRNKRQKDAGTDNVAEDRMSEKDNNIKQRRLKADDNVYGDKIEIIPFGARVDGPPQFSESVRKKYKMQSSDKAGSRSLHLTALFKPAQPRIAGPVKVDANTRQAVIDSYRQLKHDKQMHSLATTKAKHVSHAKF